VAYKKLFTDMRSKPTPNWGGWQKV